MTLWARPIANIAVFAVIVIGAWKKWRWVYYAVLVLLGVTVLLLPTYLLQTLMADLLFKLSVVTPPAWFNILSFVAGLPAVALFVWMLVALIKRGPWAMRRPQLY